MLTAFRWDVQRLEIGGELRYRLEYVTTYDGRRAGVTETARWSEVSTTTVDPPAWLDRASNESDGRSRDVDRRRSIGEAWAPDDCSR